MSEAIIVTERLVLRRWLESDLLPFIEMNNDAEVMRYFPKASTAAETTAMLQRINLHFNKNGFGLFAVEHKETRQFIGFTGFSIPVFRAFFMPCVEIGWRYKKEAWGQGYATEAASACLQYGFTTLGFKKIVSFTAALNKNSEKLMQRIGMQYKADFDHPLIDKDHVLCRHVLYEIENDR